MADQDYDVRRMGNGRWIDQKCAPDEVSFVSECILRHLQDSGKRVFLSPEIWRSPHAVVHAQEVFGKPTPLQAAALDEYNKFFRQPMKMLAAAGVLRESGHDRNAIVFEVVNENVLSFLARNEWNAYVFLHLYIEKTLRDSGMWDAFATFLERQSADAYFELKAVFAAFCRRHTPIRTVTETNRIFAKVLNPLACKYHSRGTLRGRISPFAITFDMLKYNRVNWRDVGKAKDVARKDALAATGLHPDDYFATKAKDEVRRFNMECNGGLSEVLGRHSSGEATHMHHIFPQSGYASLAAFAENIIALTPSQHLSLAHPSGHTAKISPDFQYTCLLSKNETICKNVLHGFGPTGFYSFDKFAFVLDVGFETDYFSHLPQNDFTSVRSGIDSHFHWD